jgi:hypothetical protein
MERSGIVTSAQKRMTRFIPKFEGNGHTKPNVTKVDDGYREWTSKPRAGAKLSRSLTSARNPVEFSTGARALCTSGSHRRIEGAPPSTAVTLAVRAECDPQTTL